MPELEKVYKQSLILERSTDNPSGGFSGYGSVFHTLDFHGDIVAKGAYKDDIPRFLKSGFVGGPDHNHANPIGRFKTASEDERGLYVEAVFSSTAFAQEARTNISEEVVKFLSVGIMPLQVKRFKTKNEVLKYWTENGYKPTEEEVVRAEGGARLIKRARLLEISPTALPANENAEITSYKAGRMISASNVDLINQSVTEMKMSIQRLEDLVASVVAAQAKEEAEEASEITVINDPLEVFEVTLASFKSFIEG
jgi:HK97 family phage prohead protease